MKSTGTLLHQGRPVARSITINLRAHGPRWHGEIQLSKEAKIKPGNYELQLNDRRTGRIIISTIRGDTAYFDGDGELQKL